ncbi:MAG: hypothetical protein HQM02_03930 [Magnetococcales bacterium]|nr:hypothetical protein [Magnetococcales bacterium]
MPTASLNVELETRLAGLIEHLANGDGTALTASRKELIDLFARQGVSADQATALGREIIDQFLTGLGGGATPEHLFQRLVQSTANTLEGLRSGGGDPVQTLETALAGGNGLAELLAEVGGEQDRNTFPSVLQQALHNGEGGAAATRSANHHRASVEEMSVRQVVPVDTPDGLATGLATGLQQADQALRALVAAMNPEQSALFMKVFENAINQGMDLREALALASRFLDAHDKLSTAQHVKLSPAEKLAAALASGQEIAAAMGGIGMPDAGGEKSSAEGILTALANGADPGMAVLGAQQMQHSLTFLQKQHALPLSSADRLVQALASGEDARQMLDGMTSAEVQERAAFIATLSHALERGTPFPLAMQEARNTATLALELTQHATQPMSREEQMVAAMASGDDLERLLAESAPNGDAGPFSPWMQSFSTALAQGLTTSDALSDSREYVMTLAALASDASVPIPSDPSTPEIDSAPLPVSQPPERPSEDTGGVATRTPELPDLSPPPVVPPGDTLPPENRLITLREMDTPVAPPTIPVTDPLVTGQVIVVAAPYEVEESDRTSETDAQREDEVVPLRENTAPVLVLPTAQTGLEDSVLSIRGIRVDDAEATILAMTLQVEHGTLSLARTNDLTFTQGSGVAHAALAFSGTRSAINDALSVLSYQGTANAFGTDRLSLVVSDLGATGSGGVLTARGSVEITWQPVNDPPSFVKGDDQVTNEDAGLQSLAGWATAIASGPANEAGQTVSFNTSNSNNALFALQPAIDAAGTLTYTPAANAFGSATVTAAVRDSGDGDNTSATQSFTITVNSVNDRPLFTMGANQSVNNNAGAQTVSGWATAISRGADNESEQTLAFNVSNDNHAIFSVQPAIDASGNLVYTPASNAVGSATVTVFLSDNGEVDNASARQSFSIAVNSSNNLPTLTVNTGVSLYSGGNTVITTAKLAATDVETAAASLVYTITATPAHGTLTKAGTQLGAGDTFTRSDLEGLTMWYNHDGQSTTNDAFTFSVSDGTGSLSGQTFAMTVNPSTLPGSHSASAGGEIFLGGNYIELGIAPLGSFGTSGAKPAGFTGTAVRSNVGMSFDHDGFNQGVSSAIDFFLPGSPEERWTAGYYTAGTPKIGTNSTLAGGSNIAITSLTNTSAGDTLSASLTGELDTTLRIQQEICFDVNARFFRNVVTLTNFSGATIDQVRFMRSFDPDNTVDQGGSTPTVNTVVYQEATKSLVRAQSIASDAYQTLTQTQATILFYSDDARAQVGVYPSGYAGSTTDGKSNNGFSIQNIYDPGVYDTAAAAGTSYTADQGISIAFDVGSLTSNSSATFTYYTSLDNRDVGSVLASIDAWGGDPLVLDLDGNGVQLSSKDDQPYGFDMNADGQLDRSGWVSGGDGLLVMDRNQNGKIDNITEVISEYFAPGTRSSLAALATLDENHDQRIDARDGAFEALQLQTADGSLRSLSDHHVTALLLDEVSFPQQTRVAGNRVAARAGFESHDGARGGMVEVGLTYDSGMVDAPVAMESVHEGLRLLRAAGEMVSGGDPAFEPVVPPPPEVAWTPHPQELEWLASQHAQEANPWQPHTLV